MNRSRPIGALGGGGWEPAQSGLLPEASHSETTPDKNKRDKVLADMYEMFLDLIEAEIIQSVVQMCGYNHKKSMDSLLDMCGNKNPSAPTPSPPRHLLQGSCNPPSTSQNAGNSLHLAAIPKNYLSSGIAPQPQLNVYFPVKEKKKRIMNPFTDDRMGKVQWHIESRCKIMVIMRGCPGSGKSHLAEELILSYGGKPKDYIFSTDDFFMKNNTYFFQPQLLHDAHRWNQTRVLGNVRTGLSPIIVDNTNTQLWEMTVYANMAINYGYAIEILEPETPWFNRLDELTKRNKHRVPRDKIRGMLERYEYGITVEGLIKSTGAKYSRSPPLVAEHPLIRPAHVNHANHEALRIANLRLNLPTKEQSFTEPLPNFSVNSISNMVGSRNSSLTSPDTALLLTGGDEFFFGTNASNLTHNSHQMAASIQEVKVPGLSNALNPQHKGEENSLKPFHAVFKTRIVPLKSKGSETGEGVIDVSTDNSSSNSSAPQINRELNFPLASSLTNGEIHLNSSPNLAMEENKSSVGTSETEQDHEGSGKPIPMQSLEDNSTLSSAQFPSTHKSECREGKEMPDLNSSEVEAQSHGNTASASPFDAVLEDAINSNINWMGTAIWNESNKTTQNDLIQLKPADTSVDWIGTADWNLGIGATETVKPKPARVRSSKTIEDYCQFVREINAASPNEACGWSFCENSSASWKTVDKIQEEAFRKGNSSSQQTTLINLQRSKFRIAEVQEKATNTHHADFSTLSNMSSDIMVHGVTVLNAYDRDINEGRIVSEAKVPLKLMLDKGTSTENEFEVETKKDNKQEKIKELARLFPNRSPASLKELLKQGNWDVNYVSNLLLDDADNDSFSNSFAADGSIDTDSDDEPEMQSAAEENNVVLKGLASEAGVATLSDSNPLGPTAQERAEEVKRHIEQSIDFSERSYSPHLLAIKNFKRGLREGAIPKGEPAAPYAEPVQQFKETTPELSQVPSETSDGDEDNETLQFIVGQDFIQQLADKFGGSCNVANVSPVVKFPVNLARQIYDIIFSTNSLEEEEDDGDFAMKLQCEDDERIAHELYEEMLNSAGKRSQSTPPQLREIMDMELAQAIYKADVDSLTQSSQETMANVLAKRLLEDNYSKVDKRTLHDIFASCNFSFEDTVKTLQEALSTDDEVFSEKGRAKREEELVNQAKQASVQGKFHGASASYNDNSQYLQAEYESVADTIEDENPWELSDPKANYNKYREKADQYLKERDEMYRKASDAFKRKQRSVAAYYARLGELNGKKYHYASAMAAAALAAAHTDLHSTDTLDLHSFKVVEALIVFDLFIDYQIRLLSDRGGQQEVLSVITGRGSHSVNGRPKIKPAVLHRAKKRNLRCQTLQNPGVIRVYVTADSKPSHEIPE